MKAIRDAFNKNSITAPTQTQAISGLSGIGKTQIAVEYAYKYCADYKAVFWVRADSHTALTAGFVEIARQLNLPEKDAKNPDDAVRVVNRWLENNVGWLLIFDNADTPELLKGFRPSSQKGHVLLTSCAQVFASIGIIKPIEIVAMKPDEALKFLFTRTGRDDNNSAEREAAEKISKELGYLPLALEQAGAFIAAKKARFQAYFASYSKRRLKLLEESGPVAGEHTKQVAATWEMNFSEVEKVSKPASDLLRFSAFLSPDSIPLELIAKGRSELGHTLSNTLADVDDNPLVLNEVSEPLTRYSLIRFDNDLQTYSIHRLVQDVLKDRMGEDSCRIWAERTFRALNSICPHISLEQWDLCERLLPHMKTAASLIKHYSFESDEARQFLNKTGYYCYERAQYSEAKHLLEQSQAICKKAVRSAQIDLAASLHSLAKLQREIGDYKKSEELFKQSLRVREEVLGLDDIAVGESLHNLALLYRIQKRYGEAEPLCNRSLEICKKALGPQDIEVGKCLNNLGEIYRGQGKHSEAENLFNKALDIFEQTRGSDGYELGLALNSLAVLYHDQKKYAEAKTNYMKARSIMEKKLGSEHPYVATLIHNSARVARELQEFTESESLYKQSLTIFERARGSESPDVSTSLHGLAVLYLNQNKYAEAESLIKRSLLIREKVLGAEHPDVAAVLENYADLLRATQRDVEAAKMEARAREIRANNVQQNKR